MPGFDRRFGAGEQWEVELASMLADRGWTVAKFGQAQIPDQMRKDLRDYRDSYGRPSLVRWLPDILAVRSGRIRLIDAKSEQSKTDNYAVEWSALQAGQLLEQQFHTPVFYVWPDYGVMTPEIVDQRWHDKRDGSGARGSNTSFVLVKKLHAKRLDDVFGQPRSAAVA